MNGADLINWEGESCHVEKLMIYFSCTKDTFTPSDISRVQWLQKESDYEAARWYWEQLNCPLSYQTWITAHSYGYQYAVIKI